MHEAAAPVGDLAFDLPMLVSGLVLFVTFLGIFTEGIHKIHRTVVAMIGAALMVACGQAFGFFSPGAALEVIDWNVVFLLGAMMAFVNVMIPTGGFQAIAYWIARTCGGRSFLLMVMMGTSIAVLSMFLNNLTTVVVFAPLIVLICQVIGISPLPHLLAAAMLSNIGGVATLVGDPPNLMIGSAAGIDFGTFFERMGGTVLASFIAIVVSFYFLFRKAWKRKTNGTHFSADIQIDDRRTWYLSLAILALMIVLFIFHGKLGWEAWVVAGFGLTLLFALTREEDPDRFLEKTELSLLLFFVSLFILVGGVEESKLLVFFGVMIEPLVQHDMLIACILLLWVAAIFSALIDNIPFTAAMIPVIMGLETQNIEVAPLWWALALGVGLGANGSHLGSTVNIFVMTLSEKMAQREKKPHLAVTPGLWFRKGMPATVVTLIVASVIFWIYFDFFAMPIPGEVGFENGTALVGAVSPVDEG